MENTIQNSSLISIAMATYNGDTFIKEQLDSILMQTYKNLEIIICDDGSTDRTVDIIREYEKIDKRVKLFKNMENLGFKKNFEKAISLCKGEYIALADQDDIWIDNKIETLYKNIGNKDLIHSSIELIDENGKKIGIWHKKDSYKYYFKKLVFGTTVTGCSLMFHRRLLKDFFPIPYGEKYHDWWLALLATKNNGITYCNKNLVLYRQHRNQDTGTNEVKGFLNKLKNVFNNLFNKKRSDRYRVALMQIDRLKSIKEEKKDIFTKDELIVFEDALIYYNEYLNRFFHIKSFLISKKYNDEIYYNNRYYLRNILWDIIG